MASSSHLIMTNQFGEESINTLNGAAGSAVPLASTGDIVLMTGATTPVNGGSGTGANIAGKGSFYVAQDTGVLYQNSNTKASPTWGVSAASALGTTLAGFVSGAGTVSTADTILSAFDKVVGNQAQLQNGKFTPTVETIAAAGALSTTIMESLVNNATGGDYAITLAAPSSQDGQIKIIKLGTATHAATLAMTNIVTGGFYTPSGTTTLTFTVTGDSAVLMAVGAKWILIGGQAVAS